MYRLICSVNKILRHAWCCRELSPAISLIVKGVCQLQNVSHGSKQWRFLFNTNTLVQYMINIVCNIHIPKGLRLETITHVLLWFNSTFFAYIFFNKKRKKTLFFVDIFLQYNYIKAYNTSLRNLFYYYTVYICVVCTAKSQPGHS